MFQQFIVHYLYKQCRVLILNINRKHIIKANYHISVKINTCYLYLLIFNQISFASIENQKGVYRRAELIYELHSMIDQELNNLLIILIIITTK